MQACCRARSAPPRRHYWGYVLQQRQRLQSPLVPQFPRCFYALRLGLVESRRQSPQVDSGLRRHPTQTETGLPLSSQSENSTVQSITAVVAAAQQRRFLLTRRVSARDAVKRVVCHYCCLAGGTLSGKCLIHNIDIHLNRTINLHRGGTFTLLLSFT